jgi:hypothetical protein
MRILIDEEFGYRHWEWIPHVNQKCALREFVENIDSHQFSDIYHDITLLGGMWRELRLRENATDEEVDHFYASVLNRKNYNACGHIHQMSDSYLCFPQPDDEVEWIHFGGNDE